MTAEEIFYELERRSEPCNTAVAEALSILPDKVVEKVLAQVYFVSIIDGLLGRYVDNKIGKHLIVLVLPAKRFTILHEIAHFYLGHTCAVSTMNPTKCEKEANNLANKWLALARQ
jgi:hypothetical protein